MSTDVWTLLRAGGKPAIDLLEYSVASTQLEIVFAFLVADYRNRPTALRALALWDEFCAPGAPGRIRAPQALPPLHLGLAQEIRRIRGDVERAERHNALNPDAPIRPALPPKHIFDAVLAAVTADEHEVIGRIRETYDPGLSAVANLPGGRMNAGQRVFVERVWRRQLRPQLVRSGFARIASIGG